MHNWHGKFFTKICISTANSKSENSLYQRRHIWKPNLRMLARFTKSVSTLVLKEQPYYDISTNKKNSED